MFQVAFVYLLAVVDMDYYHPEDNGYLGIFITSYEPTNVSIDLPWSDVIRRTVDVTTLSLTYSLSREELRLGLEHGVRVETSRQVTIQVVRGKNKQTNQAAYSALTLTPSSTRYFLASYTNSLKSYKQMYTVMTHRQAADVTVYRHSGGQRTPVTSFTVPANRTKHVIVQDPEVDITGLYLESTAPVSVYSGHQCVNIPASALYCDPIFQQLLPLSDLGTDHVIGPIRGRLPEVGYTARIVLTTADSDVIVTHPAREILISVTYHGSGRCGEQRTSSSRTSVLRADCMHVPDPGDFIELRIADASVAVSVYCSSPCLVLQYNHGGNLDRSHSDPFMMLVLPFRSGSGDVIRFTTFPLVSRGERLEQDNHVNIISLASGSSALRLDGQPIAASEAIRMGTRFGDVRLFSVKVNAGVHVIEQMNDTELILVQLYCHGAKQGFTGRSGSGMAIERRLRINDRISRITWLTSSSNSDSEQVTKATTSAPELKLSITDPTNVTSQRGAAQSGDPDMTTKLTSGSEMGLGINDRTSRITWLTSSSNSDSEQVTKATTSAPELKLSITDPEGTPFAPTNVTSQRGAAQAGDPDMTTKLTSGSEMVLLILIVTVVVLSLLLLCSTGALITVIVRRKKKMTEDSPGVYYSIIPEKTANYYTEITPCNPAPATSQPSSDLCGK